jgi:hypothetical protein
VQLTSVLRTCVILVYIVVTSNEQIRVFSALSILWRAFTNELFFLTINQFCNCISSVHCIVRCLAMLCTGAFLQFIVGLMGLCNVCSVSRGCNMAGVRGFGIEIEQCPLFVWLNDTFYAINFISSGILILMCWMFSVKLLIFVKVIILWSYVGLGITITVCPLFNNYKVMVVFFYAL